MPHLAYGLSNHHPWLSPHSTMPILMNLCEWACKRKNKGHVKMKPSSNAKINVTSLSCSKLSSFFFKKSQYLNFKFSSIIYFFRILYKLILHLFSRILIEFQSFMNHIWQMLSFLAYHWHPTSHHFFSTCLIFVALTTTIITLFCLHDHFIWNPHGTK